MTKEELLSKIEEDKKLLETNDEDSTKDVICKFFRGGKNPACVGCSQPLNTLLDCKKDYLSKIDIRPQEFWSGEFDKKEVRNKVSSKELALGLSCDRCQISDSCPVYQPMSMCAIDWSEVPKEPKEIMKWLTTIQATRVNMGMSIEKVQGGTPDQIMSGEMDRLARLLQMSADLETDKFKLKIEGEAKGNGGGLLSQLFGGLSQGNKTEKAIEQGEKHTIDVPFEEEKLNPEEKPKSRRNEKKLSD